MVKSKTGKKQNASYKIRRQPFRKEHVNAITRGVAAIKTGQSMSISKNTISNGQSRSRKKASNKPYNRTIKYQQMDAETPFFLTPSSIPSPPPPMSAAAAMSSEAAARAARAADDLNDLANSISRISMNEGGGGYRKNKSRRHKTRRHKTRRHKSRR